MNLPNEKFPLKTLMYKHAVGGQRGGAFVGSAGGAKRPNPVDGPEASSSGKML